jgi:phosphoserine phosphatase
MDMDSTLINIECIDEIADFAGKKAEVAAITEATMRGEIANFTESLRRRVALLNGISESVLESVYRERLRPNPGATELLGAANAAGLHTILVSGGFTFFTQRMQRDLGFTETHANTLEIQDGKLTGVVLGDIVDASGKAAWNWKPGEGVRPYTALELAGRGRQALYAGSWSEWSNTPGLPVERG